MNNINSKVYYALVQILITILSIFFGWLLLNQGKSGYYDDSLIVVSAWIGNFVLAWNIFSWWRLTKRLLSPYIIFIVTFYFFTFGLPFLRSFGIFYKGDNLYDHFSSEQMLSAQIFTSICVAFIHIGAIFSLSSNTVDSKPSHFGINNKHLLKSIKIVGWGLFIGSSYFYLSHAINNALISIQYGYMSLYNYDGSRHVSSSSMGNFVASIKLFFIPSVFLLLVAYKKKPVISTPLTAILIISVLLGFLSGERGGSTALLISYVWFRHVQIKPFKGHRKVFMVVGGFFFVSILPVIGQFRIEKTKNASVFLEILIKKFTSENPLFTAIGSLGGSMQPLLEVMRLIPDFYSFQYGETYFSSVMAIIPSFLMGGFSFSDNAALAEWLMNILNLNYGLGFSLPAETYYNFGWFGAGIMGIIGFVFAKAFTTRYQGNDKLVLKNALISIALYYLIMTSRDSMLFVFRYMFYCVIIPYVLIVLITSIQSKGRRGD
ncbi:O-antigen polysaccharide polymerase Wzy [Bacillus salacetis]|uniref:O-antigen polysaccharide polymerase Wzy n=1 Tax=Bacillus salacetis TaxID=2315464 RepID=UPI003BA06A59